MQVKEAKSPPSFVSIVYLVFSRETWEHLVQATGKYCSIRHMEYPKFHSGIFGRMESAQELSSVSYEVQHSLSTFGVVTLEMNCL